MSVLRSHGARSALLVLAAGTALAVTTATGASAAGAAVDGNAYGAEVNVTTLGLLGVTVGPTPEVTLPSTGSASPITQSLATVSAAGLLSTGVLQVSTSGAPGTDVDSSAQVAGINVPTILSADVLGASCDAASDGTLSGSSVLTNLTIGGTAVSADAAPNTVIQLAGLATVTVNEQTETGVGTANPQIVVNAIDIKLLPGLASLGTGEIVIGHAECSQEGETVDAPVGAIGGILLTGAVGAVFTVRQLRRRGGAAA